MRSNMRQLRLNIRKLRMIMKLSMVPSKQQEKRKLAKMIPMERKKNQEPKEKRNDLFNTLILLVQERT